jgi:hypothetical protein
MLDRINRVVGVAELVTASSAHSKSAAYAVEHFYARDHQNTAPVGAPAR